MSIFLRALDNGLVVSTAFLKEFTSTDDEDFDELLTTSEDAVDASLYDRDRLVGDTQQDLEKLKEIWVTLKDITQDKDPKLAALVSQLELIAEEAKAEGTSRKDEMNKRRSLSSHFLLIRRVGCMNIWQTR